MNYQQMDTKPFIPSQAGHNAAALRRRLMGKDKKDAPVGPKVIERPKVKAVWFGIQHDDHVQVWNRHREHLERMHNHRGEPIATLYRVIVPVKRPKLNITMDVLRYYPGVKLEDLKGPSRKQDIVEARQEAMYRIRKERGDSYPAIGHFFGGRDHTTVIWAVKQARKRITG